MSKAKHVQKLSATKQKRSLGEIKNVEKSQTAATKKFVRTTVVNPNEFDWPEVSESAEKELLECLSSNLECLNFADFKVPLKEIQKVEKSQRREFRHAYVAKRAAELGFDLAAYSKLKADICLGVNSVSSALERNEVLGVIIEKNVDPPIITKLLVPPARSKGIPIVAVNGLSETCRKVFKTRCNAIALKTNCRVIDHQFYKIYSFLRSVYETTPDDDVMSSCDIGSSSKVEKDHPDITEPESESKLLSLAAISDTSGFKPPKIRKV